jgi:CTP-dependent riboflavin kinase
MAKTEPKPTTQTPTPTPTPAPSLLQQIDQLKETLKSVIRDLTGLGDAVKLAEKQQRLTEKEVESARQTLEKLKQVTI